MRLLFFRHRHHGDGTEVGTAGETAVVASAHVALLERGAPLPDVVGARLASLPPSWPRPDIVL